MYKTRFFLLTFAGVAACGSNTQAPSDPVVEAPLALECEAYVAKYEHCLAALSPEVEDIARARSAQLRASLVELGRQVSPPVPVRQSCAESLARLGANCR